MAVGVLCVEAVHDDLAEELAHVEVVGERVEHLVGHVEPPELLAVGAVGDAVVELRGYGVAADDVYVVEQLVACLERAIVVHAGAYAHGGEAVGVGL